MMIFFKENLAFIAVPKTGSTSIEATLAPYCSVSFDRPPKIKHMTHKRFNRFMRPWLAMEGVEGIKTIAVMREPISWLGSWYRYRGRAELDGHVNSTRGLTFDEFVEAFLADGIRPAYAKLGSQAQQLSMKQGVIGIDHLFRYEEMGSLVKFLNERFKTSLSLEQYNVSPSQKITLSPDLARNLRNQYPLDFETYESI